MFDDKKVPKTIHLPQSLWDFIDARGAVVCRKRSQEVEYMILRYLENEQKNNEEALAMVERSMKKQEQQK